MAVVVLAVAGGAAAKSLNDRSGGGGGRSGRSFAPATTSAAVLAPASAAAKNQKRRRPKPTTNAAAVRPDGLVAAGINGAYEKDVFVFEPGGSAPIATYEFGHLPNQYTWAHTLVDGGLAWHGDRIYAITEQLSEPDNLRLRIRDLGQ